MINSSKPLHEFNEKCTQIMTIVGEEDWKKIVDATAMIFFKETKSHLEHFTYGGNGDKEDSTIFLRAFGSEAADESTIRCNEILNCIYGDSCDEEEKDQIIWAFYGYIIDQARIALGKAFLDNTYDLEELLSNNVMNIQRIAANISTCLVKKDVEWLKNKDNDMEGIAWF